MPDKKVFISFAQVKDRESLPVQLVVGRAYFVDSEGVILIDQGNGIVEYGNTSALQAQIKSVKDEKDLLEKYVEDLDDQLKELKDMLTWKHDDPNAGKPVVTLSANPNAGVKINEPVEISYAVTVDDDDVEFTNLDIDLTLNGVALEEGDFVKDNANHKITVNSSKPGTLLVVVTVEVDGKQVEGEYELDIADAPEEEGGD